MSTSALPKHLSLTMAQGLAAQQPIAQFEIGSYKNFVYLVLDWDRREAAIVDPQKDLSAPLQALDQNGFRLTQILLTHTHWDHIAGVPELVQKFNQLPVLVHAQDEHRLSDLRKSGARIQTLQDGETIQVGILPIQVLHTPGHSAGEATFYLAAQKDCPPYLLTGDTIFIRDCGRTDLETGSTTQMYASLQRVKTLPPATVILPGHHYAAECATTIAAELENSPPFQCRSVQELEALP